jgi:hypothetical protein
LKSELDSLVRSYSRLSHDIGGRMNFACDLDNEGALGIAEEEKSHLDQAFFVLSFAALERQVNLLASARLATDRRDAIRQEPFERRWQVSIQVAEETLGGDVRWKGKEREVLSWYKIRNFIAHGEAPTQLADVPSVLYQANEVAGTLDDVCRALARGPR